jgi:hypothetical protein
VEGGDTLVCDACPNSEGTRVRASIGVSECKTFMNLDGNLMCSRVLLENEPGIPTQGTYLGSCGGCMVLPPANEGEQYPVLSCTECLNAEGVGKHSELVLGPGCVPTNNGGKLACEEVVMTTTTVAPAETEAPTPAPTEVKAEVMPTVTEEQQQQQDARKEL